MLRGSYSLSFKAPDLGELHQKQIWAITTGTFVDPLRSQDGARQIRGLLGGNPNLQPEEGKVQYAGAVLELPAIKGLSFTVDFLDIKIDHLIQVLDVGFLLPTEGRRLFPNAVVRDNSRESRGPVSFVYGISENLGDQLDRGIDFGMRYSLPRTRLGSFTFTAEATQNIKRGSDSKQGGAASSTS